LIEAVALKVLEYLLAYVCVSAICYGGEWVSLYKAVRDDRKRHEKSR